MHTHPPRFLEFGFELRSIASNSGIPDSHREDLKSFQCRFESDRGHQIEYLLLNFVPENIQGNNISTYEPTDCLLNIYT